MESFELPLNPYPETFTITIKNVVYNGRTQWNVPLETWVLSLADTNDVPVLTNIPLIPGVDLLEQFEHLNIGVAMSALVDYDPSAVPDYYELGTQGKLYVGVP